MWILVTYGSKMGGTAGLAEMVAEALEERGHEGVVRPARRMDDVSAFDAIIVGGSLYAGRWHKAAAKFVKRHARELSAMPVYFFSSGPLDDSATDEEIPPTHQVAKLMESVGARGHMTFGGRMPADAKGFPASAMAKNNPGDWRSPEHVAEWVETITAQLMSDQTVG